MLQQGEVQRPPCRTGAAELEELRVVASRFYDRAVLALAQGVHRAKSAAGRSRTLAVSQAALRIAIGASSGSNSDSSWKVVQKEGSMGSMGSSHSLQQKGGNCVFVERDLLY